MFKPEDIAILVDCLDVFQKTGINYFNRYTAFIENTFQPLEKGLNEFIEYREKLHLMPIDFNFFKIEIEQRIADMKFFGFDQVNGLGIEDYQKLLVNDIEELDRIIEIEMNEAQVETNKEDYQIKRIIDNYFNFETFNHRDFENEFKRCLKEIVSDKYTYQDLQKKFNSYNSDQTYLVVSFLTKTPIKIGKTTNPAKWIAMNSNPNTKTTFGLCPMKTQYADELLVKFCLDFDTIQKNENSILSSNKMYTNLTKAEKVYHHLYGITPRKLRKIIKNSEIKPYNFNSSSIVKKKELDTLVKTIFELDLEN